MSAGEGARREAERAAAAADVLERKAAHARRRAQSFEQGSQGELAVALALAPLTVSGWYVLHDRALRHGGNLDHLLVGPGGVFVLDAKNWSGTVANQGVLRSGGRDVSKSVSQLAAGIADVRASLVGAGLDLPVNGALVLTHQQNAERPPERSGGVLVVGIAHLIQAVTAKPQLISAARVDAAVRQLTVAFPVDHADAAQAPSPQPAGGDPSGIYRRANTYLYVQPWARAGRHRLYISDETGRSLGYKDTVAGVVAVTEPDMDAVVRGVLAHATATDLGLRAEALPKLPIDLPGGRLLGAMTRLWVTFHIGYRWRKGTADRLYGWRADPAGGVADLGYVDLATGRTHPRHEEPIGKDFNTPERYLELLGNHYPAMS